MINCPYCDEKNPNNAQFCQECGKKVNLSLDINLPENKKLLKTILKLYEEENQRILKIWQDKPEILIGAIKNTLSGGFFNNTAEDSTPKENNLNSIITKTIITHCIMHNYDLDRDMKEELVHIMIEGYENKRIPHYTVKDMTIKLNGNELLANTIHYTESMRASNLSQWAQGKTEGAEYFVVDIPYNACERCFSTYGGTIFNIEQVNMIPPFHGLCSCVPSFFFSKGEAKDWTDQIRKRNELEKLELGETYATGYRAFYLAETKIKNLNKEKTEPKCYLDVIPLLERALKKNISANTKAKVYRMIGEIYYKNGEKNSALTHFEKALKYNPNVGIKKIYNKLKK